MKTTNVANAIGARTSQVQVAMNRPLPVGRGVLAAPLARRHVCNVLGGLRTARPTLRFTRSCVAAILILFSFIDALAAPFNSGSTGAYGPMNITSNTTLAMPADGIFHCTTINITNGATLLFTKNALNTPVYLLATSTVIIAGTIDVSGGNAIGGAPGAGGPGGFDGGYGGFGIGANITGGDGQGPGGGRNSPSQIYAAFVNNGAGNTNKYGNALLSPLIGGSGAAGLNGNPGPGGGGGGGAILIAANTSVTVTGAVRSRGGNPTPGAAGGSGGGIRIVSPLVNGIGSLDTTGNTGSSDGRIRIDCEDRLAFRSLFMNGVATRGTQMFVFPAIVPRLDIIEAAGQSIPAGTGNSVQIELPAGSTTNRTVRVQARDFTGLVPITVAVIPENRPSTRYNTQIDMSTGNPAEATVNVVMPDGTISRIQVWTR